MLVWNLYPFFHGAPLARWIEKVGAIQYQCGGALFLRQLEDHTILEEARESLGFDLEAWLAKHLALFRTGYAAAYFYEELFLVAHFGSVVNVGECDNAIMWANLGDVREYDGM